MINTYTIKLSAEQKFLLLESLQQLLKHAAGGKRLSIADLIYQLQALAPDSASALFAQRPIKRTEDGDILEA